MRAWLVVCAALALAPCRATAAHADPARLDRIKSQILAKLGLTTRPLPLGAPPRDVVRQILARAADPAPHDHADESAMREVIAIAQREKCPITCKGSPSSHGFVQGQKYNYGVESTVEIFLTGAAEKQSTGVKVLGQVSVTALGNCGHELVVSNLVISGHDGKKYPSPAGIEKPVQFSLQDGRLGAEICITDGDTRRSLNIKRAIISSLQSEIKSGTQYDIFGACPTEISHSQEGGSSLVHRARDLSRCAHREQGRTDLVSSVFNPGAEIKESHILQSSLNAEAKVNNGVPEKVSVSEEYLYRPFSVGENGARATVHTRLTLIGKDGGAATGHCTVPRTIIFENPHGDAVVGSNVNSALQAVKETAATVSSEATEQSAGNFAQLIRIFRSTSKDDLMKVFNQVKGNHLEKRVYLDALLRAGTGPAIEASIQILKEHSSILDHFQQALIIASLGNAKHVNEEALKAATSLLDLRTIPEYSIRQMYLGVGALAGAYCRQHECHTTKSEGVAALSEKLGAKIGHCKPKDKFEEDNVVAILKAIRNIRHLENSLVDKLVQSAMDQGVKARVKSAVLEAFTADPCSTKIHKTAMVMMKNRNLDSEIRIRAYLAVIACPCSKSASEIKNLLESEPVHQVGRFITSSLRAIRASSNPDKFLAKQHYGQISIPHKFNIDDRKYSFFREQSFNVDALGVGGSVEQTVIFSQDSFLPRSAALNLTAEIFGHSFNVLEIGGRQSNLDLVLEHFFGPRGIFRTKSAQEMYDSFMEAFAKGNQKVQEALKRGKRSVKTEIDAFDKNLKAESTGFDNELDLDVYMKLFGTDSIFLSLGNGKGFNLETAMNALITIAAGVTDEIRHASKELRAHLLFLDAELAYPTSIGLSLRLDLTGAATARLDFTTNFDINECLNNPKNAKMDIKFIPSTDVEISGVFLVDADAVSTGLKVVTNLHSSTGVHVIAKVLENGHGFDLQLGLPVDKQEIVVASNDLVYFTAEKGQKEKQTKIKTEVDQKKEYSGCFDQLSGILGLTLCGEVVLPFAINGPNNQAMITKYLTRYPITGISKLKLVLEKNDLKGYHIRGVVREDGPKSSFELLFDAEGSKNRRTQLTGEKIFSNEEFTLKMALDSPLKKLMGEISARATSRDLGTIVRAQVDDQEYYGMVGFHVEGNEARTVYKPVIEYKMPEQGKQEAQIDGQVIREKNGPVTKYSFDGIKLRLPSSQEPMSVEGFFSSQSNARNVQFSLVTDYLTVKGTLKNNDAEVEFMNQLNPLINFILKAHSEFGDTIRNEFDIVHSGDCKDRSKRIVFSQYLKYNLEKPETSNIITKNKFEIVSIPFKIQFDADVDPKKVEADFNFASPERSAKMDLMARTHIKKPEDYSVKLHLAADKHELEVFSKRDIINADKSNFENYIQVKGVCKYELSGVVHHKNNAKEAHIGAVGHLKVTYGKTEDIKFDVGVVRNVQLYSSHAQISNNQAKVVDYLFKLTRGANANGELRLVLKDTIAAHGTFKVTEADGKGDGVVIVDFKKSQRKVKADVKFVHKDPVFNAEFDIFLNHEKDPQDKICFTTANTVDKAIVDSKNKLEYGGKTSEVNIRKEGLDSDGKIQSAVEIVLPTGRCLDLKTERDFKRQDGAINGHAEVFISDAATRGGEASTISFKTKLVNTNIEKDTIDQEGQFDLKLKDGKNLQSVFSLKNVPQGNKFKFDFNAQVSGNLIPSPGSLTAGVVYLDSLTASDDTYFLKGKYGSDIGVDAKGVFVVKFDEGEENKYVDDFSMTVQLPFEKAHDIKYVSTIVYHTPASKEQAEYTFVQSVQLNGEVYKVDANGKISPHQGSGTVKLLVPHVDPVVLDADYKNSKTNDRMNNFVELKAKYGKGKTTAFSVDSSTSSNGQDLVFKASSPQLEKLKKLEIAVHSKNPAPETYMSSVIVDTDGRVYRSDLNVALSKAHPVLDFQYMSPNHPPTKIYVKGTSLSSTQGKLEAKIDNCRGVSLDLSSEANVQKDNVDLKVQANSQELGLKNFLGQIVSKDAGGSKRLEFHSTNDGKNVLSGSTSFISKQEPTKTIIEGSGSVKIKDEQKSANFKYIRTLLSDNNEKGVETFFNVAFGERSYVAESRVTNLEYKNSHVYCEEKKQCAHAEIQSKIDISKPGVIANIVNAGFDLRKLGVAPELGLIIRDEVSSTGFPQYTLDLHANKDDRKYHLHVYNTPVYGHAKSGIKVQLPQRVILLEESISYPTDKPLPFPIQGELVFDLNRNKPGHKAAARFLVDLDVESDTKQSAIAEFGFSHPKIDKEALIKVQGSAIRTGENSIKIESTAVIAHSCLGHDRESKVLFEASPTHFKFFINTPLVRVIDLEGSATVQDKVQKGELSFVLLQNKPVKVNALIKDYKYYELTTGYIAEGDRKLSVVGRIDPEKRIDFTADIVLSGQKKNIAQAALFIENDQMKTDYGLNKQNAEYFLNALRKDLDDLEGRVKELGEKASKDFKEVTQRVQPTVNKLQQAYADDFQQIYKEIVDDKVLKELSQAIADIAQYLAKMIDEVIQATKPIVENIEKVYVDTVKKIGEIYDKQLEHQIKELYETLSKVLKEYLDGVIELVAHFTAIISDFFEKHKPELQELTNTIAEIFKDLTRLLVAQLKEFRAQAAVILEEFTNYIKDLPILAALKEKYDEVVVPDQVVMVFQQAHDMLRPVLPTPEAQAFADALNDYVLKKLRKEKCDDNKELRVVYQRLISAVSSLIQYVREHLAPLAGPGEPAVGAFGFAPSSFSSSAPSFGGQTTISFLKQLINGDLPSLGSLIRAYRPRSLNPFDEIPSKLRAVVVNGQHIFTFDGRHLTFPGTCRYVLAHDHVDRNFTLVLQLADGKPKALVLEDKHGNVLELKDNGQATLNGQNHGFPIEQGDSFAFRQVNGRIGLGTLYGMMAFCTSKLEVCYVEANGFYLGKLRGLLGDGNNEPYDDFRLPNGKICTSESEFGNAYRLAKSCPSVQAPAHDHHQMHAQLPEACEKVFGGTSPLRPLQLLLDVAPFRQACIHAVASDQANALHQACDLARGYAALAVTGLLPAVLPDVCLRCTDADKPRAVGETYEFKLPGKQADIVVNVETTKMNEKSYKELIVPLVSRVVDDLKAKKVTDIKVFFTGITSRFPYPIVYDTDLKLKNAKVSFPDESRQNLATAVKTGDQKTDELIKKFVDTFNAYQGALGIQNIEASYPQLLEQGFRPGAIKHMINLVGEQCVKEDVLLTAVKAGLYGELLRNMNMGLTLATVTEDLAIGKGKQPQNVVGFDKHHVVMLGDKKLGKDSEALRETLQFTADSCTEVTKEVGGMILSTTNFHSLGGPQQKQFIQAAAASIVQSMFRDQVEQTCTCAYVDPFRVRSVCVTKSRKEKEAARRRK